MSTPFDIFLAETGGKVRWIAAVQTLEEAQRRIEEITFRSPGEYFVFNQESKSRIHLPRPGTAEMRDGDQHSITEEKHSMTNSEKEFRAWQAVIDELSFEYDREKLSKEIQALETLLFERLQQLDGNIGGGERAAVEAAVSQLRLIKRDRLGYPDWESK